MGFFSNYCNRKRQPKSPSQSLHIHSPNRISFSPESKSTASIVDSYPALKSTLLRKPHAPERSFKLRSLSNKKKTVFTYRMGNCLSGVSEVFKQYRDRKNDALATFAYYEQVNGRFLEKNNNVLVDGDGDEVMIDVPDDSSIQEVDVNDGISVCEDRKNDFMVLNRNPVYKKLHESANKRDGRISGIRFDTQETEKTLERLRSRGKGEKVIKHLAECFTPLTEEDECVIAEAFSVRNRRVVVVSHESSNIDITGEKLQCLRKGGWLNDEVINVYVALLKEREKREPEKFLKCHFFNTFFYKKLIGRGGYSFESVRRWTTQKKIGYSLLECDKIFVPIHRQNHWCLAIINKKEKKLQYLDSFKGTDSQLLDVLAKYYVNEVKDKSGKEIDISSWDLENVLDLPEQTNGYDCGMFMIKYADFYSRNLGLCFSEEHMPYFRKRTTKELLRLKAD